MKPRIYIAGPMTGYQYYNCTAFDIAKQALLELGYDVINPHDEDKARGFDVLTLPEDYNWNSLPPGFQTTREIALRCIETVHTCDSVYALQRHALSRGANAEVAYARWIGLPVYTHIDDVPDLA